MSILSLGLNHKTAPVDVREQVAVPDSLLSDALNDLTHTTDIKEANIVSTCNRTEVYWSQEGVDTSSVKGWLCNFKDISPGSLDPFLYSFPDLQAVKHSFRVASGLDSMVLGEPQILGQMKTAFATAHQDGRTGKVLNRLFQQSFAVAKEVRTETAIGSSAVSVAYAAVSLARQIFADLNQQTVLLIGAGETIQLVARHLHQQGIKKCIIANRSIERGQAVAKEFEAEAIPLDELHNRLPEADIVFSSTASTLPIIGKGTMEKTLKARNNRRVFMVDLAVPRDIEQEVADLKSVYLYTVDDLNNVVSENMKARKESAIEAENIIEFRSQDFMTWLSRQDHVPTIRSLREHIEDLTQSELHKALGRLQSGDASEVVLTQFAHALSQKIMHTPSSKLNQTDDEALIAAVRDLFELKDQ